jgi:hypothetical protein
MEFLRTTGGEFSWGNSIFSLTALLRNLKALDELYAKFRVDHPEFKVLKYSPEFKDLQIVDEWAIELVDANGTFKMSAIDDPVTVQQKLL